MWKCLDNDFRNMTLSLGVCLCHPVMNELFKYNVKTLQVHRKQTDAIFAECTAVKAELRAKVV